MSATEARNLAKKYRCMVDLVEDPLADRDALRSAPIFKAIADVYEAEEIPSKSDRTQKSYKQILKDFVIPKIGAMRASEIRRADIEALHRSLRERPYQANRAVALVRAIYNWAIAREVLDTNPCRGVKPFPEHPRQRYLSPAELTRLLAALDADSNQEVADAVRLLVLTGARRGEVLRMRWEQLDLEAGTWTKPPELTKQRRSHRVPLARAAVDVLRRRKPRAVGPFVFPGKTPESPRHDLAWAWPRIRERAELEDVRLHDLRHSFASFIASSGGSLLVIGELLGHSQVETTKRYSHLFDQVTREAAETVGEVFERAAAGEGRVSGS